MDRNYDQRRTTPPTYNRSGRDTTSYRPTTTTSSSSSYATDRDYGYSSTSRDLSFSSRHDSASSSSYAAERDSGYSSTSRDLSSSSRHDRDDLSHAAFRGQVPYITPRDSRPPLLVNNLPQQAYDRRPPYRNLSNYNSYQRMTGPSPREFSGSFNNNTSYSRGQAYHNSYQRPPFGNNSYNAPPPHRTQNNYHPPAKPMQIISYAPEYEDKMARYRLEGQRLRESEITLDASVRKAEWELQKAEWELEKEKHKTSLATNMIEKLGGVDGYEEAVESS